MAFTFTNNDTIEPLSALLFILKGNTRAGQFVLNLTLIIALNDKESQSKRIRRFALFSAAHKPESLSKIPFGQGLHCLKISDLIEIYVY